MLRIALFIRDRFSDDVVFGWVFAFRFVAGTTTLEMSVKVIVAETVFTNFTKLSEF